MKKNAELKATFNNLVTPITSFLFAFLHQKKKKGESALSIATLPLENAIPEFEYDFASRIIPITGVVNLINYSEQNAKLVGLDSERF
jgi:hypothetical protein